MNAEAPPTPALRTPEQVSEQLGKDDQGRPMVSPTTIRRLVREGRVECTRLARSRVAFTPGQVEELLDQLGSPATNTEPEHPEVEKSPFVTSKGSRPRK